MVGNSIAGTAQNGKAGDFLGEATTTAITNDVLAKVQAVLDNVTGAAEVEAAAQQVSNLVGINIAAAEKLATDALNGDLLGSSLASTLAELKAETIATGIDSLLGGKTSAELSQIVAGLLGGLNGAAVNPEVLLAALDNLGIPLSSLGLSEQHLNALLGLAVPICPVGGSDMAPGVGGATPPPLDLAGCTLGWQPPMQPICSSLNWGAMPHFDKDGNAVNIPNGGGVADRISCHDSETMEIAEYKDVPVSIQVFWQGNTAAAAAMNLPPPFQAAKKMTVSYQMFIPLDYDWTVTQRFPLGIATGKKGATGGKTGDDQTGASIRLVGTPKNGEMYLGIYSYHLNRKTPTGTLISQFDDNSTGKTKQWGESVMLSKPVPKGEWVTIVMEMTLGTPGQTQDSSALYMYDSKGVLIDSTSWQNVSYQKDDSWDFSFIPADAKPNVNNGPSQNQSYFVKDYKGYYCN